MPFGFLSDVWVGFDEAYQALSILAGTTLFCGLFLRFLFRGYGQEVVDPEPPMLKIDVLEELIVGKFRILCNEFNVRSVPVAGGRLLIVTHLNYQLATIVTIRIFMDDVSEERWLELGIAWGPGGFEIFKGTEVGVNGLIESLKTHFGAM